MGAHNGPGPTATAIGDAVQASAVSSYAAHTTYRATAPAGSLSNQVQIAGAPAKGTVLKVRFIAVGTATVVSGSLWMNSTLTDARDELLNWEPETGKSDLNSPENEEYSFIAVGQVVDPDSRAGIFYVNTLVDNTDSSVLIELVVGPE